MLAQAVTGIVPYSGVTCRINEPASNTAAVITVTAKALFRHVITGLQWSYDAGGTLSGGKITITSNSVVIFEHAITATGPGGFSFCLPGTYQQDVTITLAAGSSGVVGRLTAQTITVPQ